MAFWFFALLLFAVGDSKPANPVHQSHLLAAMAHMRTRPKIVNSSIPDLVGDLDITSVVPNEEELSEAAVTSDRLRLPEFILSHSMTSAQHRCQLLHLPNGTLVPSNITRKIISITKSRRLGLWVNNAKIATPDVCVSSTIRCHGISTMTFDNSMVSTEKCNKFDPPNDLKMTSTQHRA